MEKQYHYATVSVAIEQLRLEGYTVDFNLAANNIYCQTGKFTHEEFDVMEIYRYEGNSDPADEATVYAIESKSGIKGILVTGYGASDEDISPAMLQKLHI